MKITHFSVIAAFISGYCAFAGPVWAEDQTGPEASTITEEKSVGHLFEKFEGFDFGIFLTGISQSAYNNTKNSPTGNQWAASGSIDIIVSRKFYEHGLALLHIESGGAKGLATDPFMRALLFGSGRNNP